MPRLFVVFLTVGFAVISVRASELTVKVEQEGTPNGSSLVNVTRGSSLLNLDFCIFVRDVRSDTMSRAISNSHGYEAQFVQMVLFALQNGPSNGALLDVGANLGIYSLSAAAAGFKSYAFEPLQHNGELLAASITLNKFASRVHLFTNALSNMDTWSCIASTNALTDQGNGQLQTASDRRCVDTGSERIRVNRLDTIVARSRALHESMCSVSVVKLDTEGTEAWALRGAETIFSDCPPCLVMFEHKPSLRAQVGSNDTDPFAMLVKRLGYRCRPIRYTVTGPGVLDHVRLGTAISDTNHLRGPEYHCVDMRTTRCAHFRQQLNQTNGVGYILTASKKPPQTRSYSKDQSVSVAD
jgi:FkbM family methyltransferase